MASSTTTEERPDLSAFARSEWGGSVLTGPQLVTLLSVVAGQIGYATPPDRVPFHVLEAMGYDPVVYLGEQLFAGPLADGEIYYVRHPDPVIRAETEAWLSPILGQLVRSILQALAMGVSVMVLDWKTEDLAVTVSREGVAPSDEVVPDHVHYGGRVHELSPREVELRVGPDDELEGVRYASSEYGSNRAFVSVFDQRYGRWLGNGSRRRAVLPWFVGQAIELWNLRYNERSVDPVRLGFAPPGKVKFDGKDVPATTVLNACMMSLKNGSAASLPSEFDKDGNQLWKIDFLTAPDRSAIFEKQFTRNDALKMLASFVPPGAGGVSDPTAGIKVSADFLLAHTQKAAAWVAEEVTRVVRQVHVTRYGSGRGSSRVPAVLAHDVPAAKRKLLLEVLKLVSTSTRELADGSGKTYTLGDLISDEILDDLGLPKRTPTEAARAPTLTPDAPSGPTGRPRDATGGREQRREDARTDDGEDAVGAPGEGDA